MRHFTEERPWPRPPATQPDWHRLSSKAREGLMQLYRENLREWWLEAYGFEQQATATDDTIDCCVECLANTGEPESEYVRSGVCVLHEEDLIHVRDTRTSA